jgi:ribulose-phosphate 3-epimerase
MSKLAVSILSADFSRLGEELREMEEAGAHYVHIDVMDGHFVPNITVGVPVVASLRKCSNLVFDVHLMLNNPEDYIEAFASAGADIINFHVEAAKEPVKLIKKIKSLGKRAAITLNPETPVEAAFEYLRLIDMVLLMSVAPGFGGQEFIAESLDRARLLRQHIEDNWLKVDIQMDGGIKSENVGQVVAAGVSVVVAGSAIFDAKDKKRAVRRLLGVIEGGY